MKLWQTEPSALDELVERFTAGEDVLLDARLVYFDLCGTVAHVRGLGKIAVLNAEEVAAVCAALQSLWEQGVDIQLQDEDVHTAVENALVGVVGELGQKIHTGRSRNDQVLVDVRLYTKSALLQLSKLICDLSQALTAFATKYEKVPMPGFTHTRYAMPSSVGVWAASLAEGLLENLAWVDAAFDGVDRCPLGAAAGYGVPLPLERQYVSDLLGFRTVQINPLNTTSGRAKVDYGVLCALTDVMLDLGRLSADLIWMSSDPMPFFELPEQFCTGSSIMPNKRNPDVLELIRAKGARVQAAAAHAFAIAHGAVSGYHRDHQELKPQLMDALDTVRDCLAIVTPLIQQTTVNEDALNRAITPDLFAVDEMIEETKRGTPLRQAYRNVKNRLDQLKDRDIQAALLARSHLGGAGNLGLDTLTDQIRQAQKKWQQREKFHTQKLNALIARR